MNDRRRGTGVAPSFGTRGSHRAPPRRRLTPLRVALMVVVLGAQVSYLAASSLADGGDFSLNFASATPGTYDQSTGTGGTFDDVVQQLNGGDFNCGDIVQHLTEVVVDDGATGTQDIVISYSFDTETTSGDAVGYVDVTYASINPNDPNNDLSGNETVTLGTPQVVGEEILVDVTVTGLEAGEVLIVSVGAELGCNAPPGANVTGNIHATLESAETSLGDPIGTGNDDTPLINAGAILGVPDVSVLKTCTPEASTGEVIEYQITISNDGNEDLTIDSVIDTVLGDITSSFPTTLPQGGTPVTETFTHTVTVNDPNPLVNEVTVVATGVTSQTSDTANGSCSTVITQLVPDIEVTKDCTDAEVGEDVTYTIRVTNTGTDDLENIIVLDTVLGNLSGSFVNTLAPGEFDEQQFTHTVTPDDPDPLENTVLARARGVATDATVQDIAQCSSDIIHVPAIEITKECTTGAAVGEDVTYTIRITNTGTDVLEDIVVFDTVLGNLSGSFVNTLDPGEFDEQQFTHTVTADDPDPLVNTVGVVAFGQDSGDRATSIARCTSDIVQNPAIDVQKSCPETVLVGDDIEYEITVTNTGDEALENVTVIDSVLGDLSGLFSDTFEPGQSETIEIEHEATNDDVGELENTVTASGSGVQSGTTVTDVAECETDVRRPIIAVTGANADRGVGMLLVLVLGGLTLLFLGRRPQLAVVGGSVPSRHGAHAGGVAFSTLVMSHRGKHRRYRGSHRRR